MATCKESTDEVDGRGNGNSSMDVTMPDEITLHDGNYSDGNVTDSSTDSETTPGRGIDVIVNYKNKLRKQLLDFKKPLYIPLTLEKYLKWQFITNNSNLLQQRMTDLAKITENVTIRKGILEVFLRRQKEHHDFDILAKTLEEILLSDTDSIAVSWFPLKASHQGTEFLQVLNRVVQHSDLANELYIEMTDTLNSKVIRFVHDVKIFDRAKEITNQAVHEFEKQLLSNWHSINIDLPIVYSHIFEKYEMKSRVENVFPTVLVFLDIMESKDKLNVELRGQQNDLNRVRKWIEELFIDPYCCLELGFNEFQMCEESIDIPSVITNTLERNNYQDLFWTISTHSKKTWICSAKGDDAHEALQVVKKCINQTKKSKKTSKPVEEIESIVEELVSVHRDILGRSVSVRVLAEDDKDLAIYLTGDEHQLDHINNWFDSYTHSTTDVDTYAATKQDAYFTPGSDQSRTQSDPTISSTLIQDTSQASSPIVPATEKAIVEDPLIGLSPKTGSPKRVKHVSDVDIRQTDDIEPNPPASNNRRGEPKQVMFSDGIRPGGDLTELDGSSEVTKLPPWRSRVQKRVEKVSTDVPEAGINIDIIIGQLIGSKADAIVNTTGKHLDLSKGNVSKALLKSAGDTIQKELYLKRPKGIEYWEIVQTGPYGLPGCKVVLHGALGPYEMKRNNRLQKFVFDCLAEADKQKCSSIAFPAIGTCHLGYPKQEVAQAMFEAVKQFEDRQQFLKEVKFVLYPLDKETIQAFQTAEKFHSVKVNLGEQKAEWFGYPDPAYLDRVKDELAAKGITPKDIQWK